VSFVERFKKDYHSIEKLEELFQDIATSQEEYELASEVDDRVTELYLKEALFRIRINKKLLQMRTS